jgi:DNA mismatch endonuclease, patch repair protein
MDNLDAKARRRAMSAIRPEGGGPEMVVRRALFACGLRYRLHGCGLPGRPDLVLPRWGAVVFVNGCFWHGHDCKRFRFPASRIEYWGPKITRNRERDRRVAAQLRRLGWRVLLIWECELAADAPATIARLVRQLRSA